MRHVFLPAPVTACPQGMGDTAAAARLVAPAGRALGLTAGVLCAASGAVDLAAVAMAADEHAGAAAGAQKEPGRRLRTPSGAAGRMWTKPAVSGILPRMRARHGVGRGAETQLGR